MKKLIAFSALFALPLLPFAKNFSKWDYKDYFTLIPEGELKGTETFHIEGAYKIQSFYMFKTEVPNKLYSQFENELLTSNIDLYSQVKRSDKVWETLINPQASLYNTHPAYDQYPAVGITKNAALEFCKWLEIKLNEAKKTLPQWKGKTIKVDLPTEQEWMYAALGNSQGPYPWGGPYMRNSKGWILANFISKMDGNMEYDSQDLTAPVISYWPNNFGLYNMSGNVREIIKDSENAKGGSWNTSGEYLKINAKDPVADGDNASADKGFRPIVRVI